MAWAGNYRSLFRKNEQPCAQNVQEIASAPAVVDEAAVIRQAGPVQAIRAAGGWCGAEGHAGAVRHW